VIVERPPDPSPDLLGLALGGEGAITGTVICTSVIAYGVEHVDSTAQLSLIIVATVGVYWLAHLHALTIGNALNSGHHPVTALRHAFIETLPLAAASIVPLAVLLVTRLLGADLSTSAWTALWVSVGLLAVYSYVGGARGGLDFYGRILSALVGASIGVLVALLKVALH
jgi:hypothetical protein